MTTRTRTTAKTASESTSRLKFRYLDKVKFKKGTVLAEFYGEEVGMVTEYIMDTPPSYIIKITGEDSIIVVPENELYLFHRVQGV
jgi:hypothetical protein